MKTKQTTTEPAALSAAQTAARYNVTKPTIIRWSGQGVMPHAHKVGGTVLRWRVADLVAWEERGFPARLQDKR